MALAIHPKPLEYRIFCAKPYCTSERNITRCVICQLFAFCQDHSGSKHHCLPAAQNEGQQLPDLPTLLDLFKKLKKPPQPDSQRVRSIRVNITSGKWKESDSAPAQTEWERRVSRRINCVSEYTLKNERYGEPFSSILVVEFTSQLNDPAHSTLVLMKHFPVPEKLAAQMPVAIPAPQEDPFAIVDLTIPNGVQNTMGDHALWRYGDCLICGYTDSAVMRCSACDLLVHPKCAPGHTSSCEKIVSKAVGEGSQAPAQKIANYLCTEMTELPQNSRVLHVDMRKPNWDFLNADNVCTTIAGSFGERVLSVLLNIPHRDHRVIVAIDGDDDAQQRIMVLTSTAKNCTIM